MANRKELTAELLAGVTGWIADCNVGVRRLAQEHDDVGFDGMAILTGTPYASIEVRESVCYVVGDTLILNPDELVAQVIMGMLPHRRALRLEPMVLPPFEFEPAPADRLEDVFARYSPEIYRSTFTGVICV